jgi:carbamoyl-phosphate synthase large subunit
MKTLSGKVVLSPFCDGTSDIINKVEYPFIVKERFGQGSKKVYLVTNETELLTALEHCSFPLVQEYIDDTYGEYSVGIFCQKEQTNIVAFKRKLSEGMGTEQGTSTWYAEIDNDAEVIQYAREIADYIKGEGSYNVQVRKSSKGVRLLEINPRFSGLIGFRHFCGFTDLLWSLQSRLDPHWKLPAYHPPSSSAQFWRFVSETMTFGDKRQEGIW